MDNIRDNGAKEAIARLEALLVYGEEGIEVVGQALPERRRFGLSWAVDLYCHAAQCRKEGVPSNGTPSKKVGEK